MLRDFRKVPDFFNMFFVRVFVGDEILRKIEEHILTVLILQILIVRECPFFVTLFIWWVPRVNILETLHLCETLRDKIVIDSYKK